MSPTEIAGMALLAVLGLCPRPNFLKTFPAVAEAESLIVVEVASSTNLMEPAGPPPPQYIYDWQSDGGSLVQDDMVTVPDVALFPENVELGEPTELYTQ